MLVLGILIPKEGGQDFKCAEHMFHAEIMEIMPFLGDYDTSDSSLKIISRMMIIII